VHSPAPVGRIYKNKLKNKGYIDIKLRVNTHYYLGAIVYSHSKNSEYIGEVIEMVIGTAHKTKKMPGKIKSGVTKEVHIIEMAETPSDVEERIESPLAEVMTQAEKAYVAYREAEQQVARAYHENEIRVGKAFKRAEEWSQNAYENAAAQALKMHEEALAEALRAREDVIQRAEESFRAAKEIADKNYDEAMAQAIREHHDNAEKAWKVRDETLELAWKTYSKMTK
jgi:hypothetical protein